MPKLSDLKIKLFTDGAEKAQIVEMAKQPWIKGFTTNPSLLKKAGVKDYAVYGRDLASVIPDRHISLKFFPTIFPRCWHRQLQRIRWPGDDKDAPHDFRVLLNGKPVDHIYRRNAHGESWSWSIYGGVSGLADTCEGAQAALKAASQLKETVGLEACATAHHWARELTALGHETRLMPPTM